MYSPQPPLTLPRVQSRLPISIFAPSSRAAAPLVVQETALLHAVHAHVLAPLAAVLLALGRVEPAAVARVIACLALDKLGEVAAGGGLGIRGGGGGDEGENGEESGGEFHFEACERVYGMRKEEVVLRGSVKEWLWFGR